MVTSQHAHNGESSTPAADPKRAGEPTSSAQWLTKPRILRTAIAALFLIIVIGGSWAGLRRIEQRTRERVGDSLGIVVEATQESLRAWLDNVQRYADRITNDPRVVELVGRQLAVTRTQDSLLASAHFEELRTYFGQSGVGHGEAGFFLIAPDLRSVFSMRDQNVGVPNLIAEQRPDLLQKAFDGATVFIPPISSDVPLPDPTGRQRTGMPTMFVAAPVKDAGGEVIAVLTIRFDPSADFTRLCQLGRMGRTGETYAFDRTGLLISESRFEDSLARIGLIEPDQQAILSIRISDPGGPLQAGHKPSQPPAEQPLTRMASEAVAERSGVEVNGYRDYRGAPVLGAWVWDEELQIGLATEIDQEEALEIYRETRTIVLLILGVTVVLTFLLIGFVMLSGRRIAGALRGARDDWERIAEERAELGDLLLESARDGIFGVGPDGIVMFVNAFAAQLLEFEREEILGQRVHELVHHSHRDGSPYALEQCPMYRAYTEGTLSTVNDEVMWRKDGTSFEVEYTSVPIRQGDSIVGAVVVFRDISERKRAEDEMVRIRFLSDSALELTRTGYWEIDYDDPDFYISSERTAAIFGEPPKSLHRYHLQDEWYDRVEAADSEIAPQVWEIYAAAIEGRSPLFEATYPYMRPVDGCIVWIRSIGSIVRDDSGAARHMYGVAQDITEQKQAEENIRLAREAAEEANRAKSDFLSHMSHELRTPLNGVLGYAQILQRDPDATRDQKESLAAIESCGTQLLSLINDVLDLSKIEAGRLEVDQAPCDLNALLKSVRDVLEQRAQAKGLAFEVEVSPEVPRGIVTDAAKLRQILVNLIGNAVKFTAEGGVALRISEVPKGRLHFEVADTGPGMSPEELTEIFDPFKQVEAGKAAGGTGLGLAITQRIVNRLGGRIDVESEKGKGSTFRVELPLVEVATEDMGTLETDGVLDGSVSALAPGQKCTVLVADDRETNRDIMQRMLEMAGIESLIADDGDTALELLHDHDEVDLVLMDVRMPRMDGIAAIKQIRADKRLKEKKVIAVTASVFPEFREKAIAAGFDDFLGKPFRAEELFQKLRKHLSVEFVEESTTPDDTPGTGPVEELPGRLASRIAARIREAVALGNITALHALARELESADETAAYGRKIGELAHSFDFESLEHMIKKLEDQVGESPQ